LRKRGQTGKGEERWGGWRSLGAAGSGIARKALGGKGRAFAAFITDWPAIVGQEEARHCQPLALRFPDPGLRRDAVLTLKVDSAAWSTELSHRQAQLLERINGYFGYPAVASLRFKTGPLPRLQEEAPAPGTRERPLSKAEEERLEALLAAVENPGLRRSLERLGRRLFSRR
jgi:hypothetical protein